MTGVSTLPYELEQIGTQIVDAAFKVHSALGPGLLEKVYEACIMHELKKRMLLVESQVYLPVHYDGITIESGLRLDLLVNKQVIIELKVAEILHPVFGIQLKTYLKLTGLRLGYLINFNVPIIKSGIHRIIL
jgi:GxxExxY protein